MSKFCFALQDDEFIGDAILREGDSEKEVLRLVEKQYPKVNFFILSTYRLAIKPPVDLVIL